MSIRETLRSQIWRKSLLLKRVRYLPGSVTVMGSRFRYVDWPSFVYQHRDIVVREIYRVPYPRRVQVVLDCGVNVGLSMRYFLSRYPAATVYGWEADPALARVALKIIAMFPAARYRLEAKAVWVDAGEIAFHTDKADSGSIIDAGASSQTVPTVRLLDTIEQHDKVDFLKLDVEGAEFAIMDDIASVLGRIQSLFVEVHINSELSQRLPGFLDTLVGAGFNVRLEAVGDLGHAPFAEMERESGFDSQINIFCDRRA